MEEKKTSLAHSFTFSFFLSLSYLPAWLWFSSLTTTTITTTKRYVFFVIFFFLFHRWIALLDKCLISCFEQQLHKEKLFSALLSSPFCFKFVKKQQQQQKHQNNILKRRRRKRRRQRHENHTQQLSECIAL